MIGQYKVTRPTRRCAAADRPLQPGEHYYSVISGDEDHLVRLDYAASDWTGPPEGAIGHWKRQMPAAGPKKLVLAPPSVLIDLLRGLEQFPERAAVRYVLALLLMRKRLVEPVESGSESMTLNVLADGSQIALATPPINPAEAKAIGESLDELLYAEEAEEADDDSNGGGP